MKIKSAVIALLVAIAGLLFGVFMVKSAPMLSRVNGTSVWGSTSASMSISNNMVHSIVTAAAAANGWLVDADSCSSVSYNVEITTTANIGGGASGYILLEMAASNSSTAGDWSEVGRLKNGQTITLALTLQSVQVSGGQLYAMVPPGYYVRLRSVNTVGTPAYAYISGQEVHH